MTGAPSSPVFLPFVAASFPAVALVGRKNSGKTTLAERLIATLAMQYRVASVKHHGHPHFEIDHPGKDSYRHRQAGARATIVFSSEQFALMKDQDDELAMADALQLLAGYDLIVVEGYKQSGLPCIELFRAANERDVMAAQALMRALQTQTPREDGLALPLAVVTDIPELAALCDEVKIPRFGFEDVDGLAFFVQERFVARPLSVVIQAGGESKRMGMQKPLVPFLGKPLIEHVISLVGSIADELIVTAHNPEILGFLESAHPHVRITTDVLECQGALPGLLSALSHATHEHVGLVACDMIAASPRLLTAQAALLQQSGSDAVVVRGPHGSEPFLAVYRKSTCLPLVKSLLEQKNARMQSVLDNCDVTYVSAEEVSALIGHPCFEEGSIHPFVNVNTPAELVQAQELYRLYAPLR